MEITGVCDPEARIKQVRRSRSRVGIEWHRMTRSKSPARKRCTASFTDEADWTMYPASRKTVLRVLSDDESRPTERISVSGIGVPFFIGVMMARSACAPARANLAWQVENIGGRAPADHGWGGMGESFRPCIESRWRGIRCGEDPSVAAFPADLSFRFEMPCTTCTAWGHCEIVFLRRTTVLPR